MDRHRKNDLMVPKHAYPKNIHFSLFTTEEMKKICVQKIVTPLTFDPLGHPLPGGLYDRNLGPMSERGDPCGMCSKNMYECPGHFGYIELPLPVVNPIFHKIIGIIFRISCLHCFKIQINDETRVKIFEMNDEIQHIDQVKAILDEFKSSPVCIFCNKPMEKVQVLKNKIFRHARMEQRYESPSNPTRVMAQKVRSFEPQPINPRESRDYMRKIYQNEDALIKKLIPVVNDVNSKIPTDTFYFEVIPVPPPNTRPVNFVRDRILENPQTESYKKILQNVIMLGVIIRIIQKKGDEGIGISAEAKAAYSTARGNTPIEKLNICWEELQNDVNGILDKDALRNRDGSGLKQLIEKKAGIIRMHMMGKRVNFAARSVITPDPNLSIDEIGIPEAFAKRLTYPVPVTPWNVEELRKLILNGPEVHPGAVQVEYEDGSVKRINPKNLIQQESLLKVLLTPNDKGKGFQGVKIVHRHLINGDILLLNRQPTLHKPSIMAHSARILKGEKTLRLHYANCKSYNADFDGDEMNAHFPQNELARSEGYNIVSVPNQYLVPKDGTPLSGLIQDHMISGVKMTLRGKFFSKEDYQQLVFQALSYSTARIRLLKPAIIKPVQLWSGKQIISTIIINIIPEGKKPINMTSTSKIPAKAWQSENGRNWLGGGTPFKNQNTMSEAEVIIRSGELLVGILDKTHYGATPYGLIHCIYELYGGTYAVRLLSSFAKLFTNYLQWEGFTLGVHDILTVKSADKKRKKIINNSRKIGKDVIITALDLPKDSSLEDLVKEIEKQGATNPKLRQIIDRQYKTSLDSFTNDINKVCLPAGLVCKFPQNNLQLMVLSGAKGSTVNTMQISCLLGQIELEGKRPPVMISGRSLPSFPSFEFSPRAGGFIDNRFMTGVQPQEFFFHCMAGREGLIDTAVKTSRSGYLQRCLIKHLEGLHVGYDMTVRNSDGNLIQFLYGEDGMDISKAQFLNKNQCQFLFDNQKAILDKMLLKKLKDDESVSQIEEHQKEMSQWKEKHENVKNRWKSPFSIFCEYVTQKSGKKLKKKQLVKLWRGTDKNNRLDFNEYCKKCPDPVSSIYQPDRCFGSLNEKLEFIMNEFTQNMGKKDKKSFTNMMKIKSMLSLCAPGEPVGLLAAQSIGEPSTQMTLNTFHFAGRGEMNVTLGIPRLREILMMASRNIKTPSMEIPFLNVKNVNEQAEQLRKILNRVVVANVLEKIDVNVTLELEPTRQYTYTLVFHILPEECYNSDYNVRPKQIIKHMEKTFFKELFIAIMKQCKIKSNLVAMEENKISTQKSSNDSDDEDENENNRNKSSNNKDNADSSEEEIEDDEDAKTTNKVNQFNDVEEQEPVDEEKSASENDEESEDDEQIDANKNNEKNQDVVDRYTHLKNYSKDSKNHRWCRMTFSLPLNFKKLDLSAILKDVAAKSVLWETQHIKRAITYMKEDKLMLRTDGINIVEMFKYNKLLDLSKLHCNDIHKMAETYGIEAAAKIIVKEVKDVFNVYGIKVDSRHLSLIADYMTSNGTFEPLSRKGIETSNSPLQQMSFESSLTFLKTATIRGKYDELQNPSSCLMIGKPCNTGTGCFTLLHKIPTFAA